MKNILLAVFPLFFIGLFILPTKEAEAQTAFGMKVGPNFSNMTVENEADLDTKINIGIQGGLYANLPIGNEFYIQPSLMYENKGTKIEISDLDVDMKMNLNYLTLPVDFLYKPEMLNGSGSWIIGAGPYVGYGISGKAELSSDAASFGIDPFKKSELDLDDPTGNEQNDAALFDRFDAGVNVQLGYELARGFNAVLNGNLGLINFSNDKENLSSAKNVSFGIMLGYTF